MIILSHTYDICEVLPLHCTSLHMFMKYSRWPTHAPYVGSRRKLSLLRSTWCNGWSLFWWSGCWTWVDAHDWKIMVAQLMQTAVAWYSWLDPLLPSWCICYLSPSSWILFATHRGLTGFNLAVAGDAIISRLVQYLGCCCTAIPYGVCFYHCCQATAAPRSRSPPPCTAST
jgi:hypothetical protein